jgi:hypothetical protein
MSERVRELATRQAELQLRCAFQRRAVAREVQSLEARFDSVDRIARMTRGVLGNPAVIAGGIIALLILGRLGGLRLLGNAVLLAAATRKSLQAFKRQ